MFDLEPSIADWRRQMQAAGIKSPVPLEEMECHLRDEIDQEMRSGLPAQGAFEIAARRLGPPISLKTEFGKIVAKHERTLMNRTITILAGLFGTLFGFAMVWPELGMLHRTGVIPNPPALLLGAAIILAAGGVTLYQIRRHRDTRGRKLVAICLVAVGGLCSAVNASTLLSLSPTERLWWPPVVAAVAIFFASCFYLNRPLRASPTNHT